MKQVIILVLIILVACNNSDTTKDTSKTQKEEQYTDTTKNKSERQTLIEELKRLQQIIASNDKEKIADIFKFPLSGTAFSIYIDDSVFQKQFKANANKTTKTMFLQYFKQICNDIWLEQLDNLLQLTHIDSLLYKDTLEYKAYIKYEPCFYSYQIEIVKNGVILRMNMNSNKNYKNKNSSENDIPKNSSEICEHSLWWVFGFDGEKLHFQNISGAG